jgi:hypothetical protein
VTAFCNCVAVIFVALGILIVTPPILKFVVVVAFGTLGVDGKAAAVHGLDKCAKSLPLGPINGVVTVGGAVDTVVGAFWFPKTSTGPVGAETPGAAEVVIHCEPFQE